MNVVYIYIFEDGGTVWSEHPPSEAEMGAIEDGILQVIRLDDAGIWHIGNKELTKMERGVRVVDPDVGVFTVNHNDAITLQKELGWEYA